jgi:acyl transferase domain-containing protein/surfactin synthase thioesterase subunit
MTDPDASKAALRRAALVIQRLERRLEERAEAEPIAIVGVGCRLPGGATDLQTFWDLLQRDTDAVGVIPPDRFDVETIFDPDPALPRKTYAREAAFVGDVTGFDADFFGVSPREAAWIDPQHRLLLECSWEALEDAGVPVAQIRGAQVGVYVGIGSSEYAFRLAQGSREEPGAYFATGTGISFSAGRISYLLGLQGPALAVDTACSSSLVAIHLACRALQAKECELALAGGVQLMMWPQAFVLLSRLRALAPDGRCKTFSDRADGYGRGEGCGVIALERLSDARRKGHRILAVVRGTAINHDGASSGLTTPNGAAQQAVIQQALDSAGISGADVDYVQAHGTGTALGDPIEIEALAHVYGQSRRAPLWVGAVKTSIGHLESAAGVAGVIGVVAALQNEALPVSHHAARLNPFVDWDAIPVQVVRERQPWPRGAQPRRAGVSAFGMSGTNAHLIIEEAPPSERQAPPAPRAAELILLSAKTPQALNAAAGRLLGHLQRRSDVSLSDLAYSSALTRSAMEYRLAVVAPHEDALLAALGTSARGADAAGCLRGRAQEATGRLAWLFTGQGAQQLGMGRGLYGEWAAFRNAFDEALASIDRQLDRPLRDVMWAEGATARALLDQTQYTQPALFALEYGLAALWRSWGVVPDIVMGHSIGEITAACVAGVYTLPDAVRLVCARARLMQALPSGGAMASIAAPEKQVRSVLEGGSGALAASVSVAAVNGPASTVVSGDEASVLSVAESFERLGVQVTRLAVSHAFHSRLMEPMLGEFAAVARSIEYHPPKMDIVSNVTGRVSTGELRQPDYWVRHVRETVRFSAGVRALSDAGVTVFTEIGPKSTLLGLVSTCLQDDAALLLPSLRANRPEPEAVLEALGGWVVRGGRVTWPGVYPAGGRFVDLPKYAWQREKHWVEPVDGQITARATRGVQWRLSGERIELPSGVIHHVLPVGTHLQSYLRHHVVYGMVVVPGAFYLSTILAAATERWPGVSLDLENVEFIEALLLQPDEVVEVHLVLSPEAQGDFHRAEVFTRRTPTSAWVTHARGRIGPATDVAANPPDVDRLLQVTESVDPAELLAQLASVHIVWGPDWFWIKAARKGQGVAVSDLVATDVAAAAGVAPLHPVVIDNGFGSATWTLENSVTDETGRVPFSIGRMRWLRSPVGSVRCAAALRAGTAQPARMITFDLGFWDADGLVAVVDDIVVGYAPRERFLRALARPTATVEGLYRIGWKLLPLEGTSFEPGQRTLVVCSEASEIGHGLERALRERAVQVTRCDVASVAGALMAANVERVICIWDSESADPAATSLEQAIEAVNLLRPVARLASAPQLFWITRGAVAVSASEDTSPAACALWGLGRTVMREHPELSCKLVDLTPDTASSVTSLLVELGAADDEDQVAWRAGERLVARLESVSAVEPDAGATRARLAVDGTLLITGGLGGLGYAIARLFAQNGTKHLLLLSRQGLEAPGARERVVDLEKLGAEVTVAAVDVADESALARVLDAVSAERPLRGVVHAAGVIDDGVLLDQTPDRLAAVMAPKVAGAWNLHRLTARAPLEMFVSFSSIAGTLGAPAQGIYAAANAFLDGLAAHRQAQGRVASSLAWGPWAQRGLAAGLDSRHQARLVRHGMVMISPEQGLSLFCAAISLPDPRLVVAPLDLRAAAATFGSRIPPLWRVLLQASASSRLAGAAQLESLPASERGPAVIDLVRSEMARVLSQSNAAAIPLDKPLKDLGLDSLLALEFRNALGRRTGFHLPATLTFEQPTLSAIVTYLLTEVTRSAERGGDQHPRPRTVAPGSDAPSASPEEREVPVTNHRGELAEVAVSRVPSPVVCELLRRVASPSARLFCFHDAGGSPTMFAPFVRLATLGLEVHAISVSRTHPATDSSARQYLDTAAEYIRTRADTPYALFGHSLGALFAWRLARELAHGGQRPPALCGISAPPINPTDSSFVLDGDEAFRLVFGHKALAMQELPALRRDFAADVSLCKALPAASREPLQMPIAAFVGREDSLVSEAALQQWHAYTTGDFALTVVPGDHFYIYQSEHLQILLDELSRRILAEVSRAPLPARDKTRSTTHYW